MRMRVSTTPSGGRVLEGATPQLAFRLVSDASGNVTIEKWEHRAEENADKVKPHRCGNCGGDAGANPLAGANSPAELEQRIREIVEG